MNLEVLFVYLPLGLVLVKLHLGADESVVVAAVVLQLLLAQVDDLRAHAVHKVLKRSEVCSRSHEVERSVHIELRNHFCDMKHGINSNDIIRPNKRYFNHRIVDSNDG